MVIRHKTTSKVEEKPVINKPVIPPTPKKVVEEKPIHIVTPIVEDKEE